MPFTASKTHALIDLIDSHCELLHHSEHQAVDFLVQHFGRKLNDVESKIEHTLQIPICQNLFRKELSFF